ncbi:nitrogen regulation protein NR(II) [Hyphomonas sp.]|uniref:two-component system sensor histidine kinase NtrB n=1 Tax=Hyphomonas sp. TaxID=87 RepID=UPI003529117E
MPVDTLLDARSLADLSPVALLVIDDRRRIVDGNPEAETLFQLSRRSLTGKPLSELIYHDSLIWELLDRAQRQVGDIASPGTPVTGPSITSRLVCDVWVRTTGDEGFVIALVETAVREGNDSSAGVAGFGRILGHEVKNPLGGIIGAAQLLERQGVEGQSELLAIIRDEARRIERLVNRLSAFELFSAPRMKEFNIHALLDRVIASERVAIGEKVDIKRDFDPSLPELLGDEDHLQQAFQNIIRNAAEAAQEGGGGQVTIRTAYATGLAFKRSRFGVGLQRAMLVTVEDNGRGIPREKLSRIFDVFQSSKSGARGLGLSVVKEVITAHGGQIRVDSEPGTTRFTVLLPIRTGGLNG